MSRLQRRLSQANHERRGILIGFLPAGFPTPHGFLDIARAAFDAGLDALEVSMPGPAPELDGPLIQDAARRASEHLSGIDEALRLAAASRVRDDDTIIALAYERIFDTLSTDEFLDKLVANDVDAYLLPERPVAAQLALAAQARERGIEGAIFLHLQKDLEVLAASTFDNPFIYLQSSDQRTGGRFSAASARERLDEVAAAMNDRPYSICVGFGVRAPEEVDEIMSAGANGAIIGSRLVVAADRGAATVAAIIDEVAPALVRRDGMTR